MRDTTSHYPWPTEERLRRYLEDLADWEGDFVAHPSSVGSIRATFADTVLLQALVDEGGEAINDEESKELLKDMVQGVTELVITGIRLCQHIIATYVATLPPEVLSH